MKINSIRMSVFCTVLIVSGCASGPVNRVGAKAPSDISIRQDGVKPASGFDVDLKEQTKGKIVALTTVKTIASLFGGGTFSIGQRNRPPVDGYTETKGHITSFSADEVAKFKGPAAALSAALDRKFVAHGVTVSAKGRYSLQSVAQFWGIDYEKLTEKNDYRLYYNITTKILDGDRPVMAMSCIGATDEKHGLDEWLANDRADVKRDAAAIGDICADKVVTSLGVLPTAGMVKTAGSAPQ